MSYSGNLKFAAAFVSRAINNNVLDTYQLKSLDAVVEAPLEMAQIVRNGTKFHINSASHLTPEGLSFTSEFDNFAMREPYDRVIRCLGFRFNESLFNRLQIPLLYFVVAVLFGQ